jgi:hypothetical protein
MLSLLVLIFTSLTTSVAGTGKQIAIEVIKFAAAKALLLFIVFVAFPIIIYALAGDIIVALAMYGVEKLAGIELGSFQGLVQLTGMGGWIADKIALPDAIALFMAFVSIKFDMKIVRAAWRGFS